MYNKRSGRCARIVLKEEKHMLARKALSVLLVLAMLLGLGAAASAEA